VRAMLVTEQESPEVLGLHGGVVASAGRWMICQGCGASFRPGEEDLYVEHVQMVCEFVDGAGNPRTATCRHCGPGDRARFVDGSDIHGWVHAEDDEVPCRPEDPDSPQAEPEATL
jgi:hypothetical protein